MKELDNYLKEIVNEYKKILGDRLIAVSVFGNINNFQTGKSDVDMIVIVNNKETKKSFGAELLAISERLNEKYGLVLYYTHKTFVDKLLWNFINSLGIRNSVMIATKEEFEKRKFFFCNSISLAALLIPKRIVWKNVLNNNKIIYGELPKIEIPKVNILDWLKAPLPSIGAVIASLLLRPFSKEKSDYLNYAAIKWMKYNAGIENAHNIIFSSLKYYLHINQK